MPPAATCRKCGTPMHPGDNFCGKCGNPAVLKCMACNNEVEEEDRFCAKCGAKLSFSD
jgi:predicted amidophosphoribosyltransferase